MGGKEGREDVGRRERENQEGGWKEGLFSPTRCLFRLTSAPGPTEPPSTRLWATVLLAQHHDALRNCSLALELINEALEHTPTEIQLYTIKAKICRVSEKFADRGNLAARPFSPLARGGRKTEGRSLVTNYSSLSFLPPLYLPSPSLHSHLSPHSFCSSFLSFLLPFLLLPPFVPPSFAPALPPSVPPSISPSVPPSLLLSLPPSTAWWGHFRSCKMDGRGPHPGHGRQVRQLQVREVPAENKQNRTKHRLSRTLHTGETYDSPCGGSNYLLIAFVLRKGPRLSTQCLRCRACGFRQSLGTPTTAWETWERH